MEGVGDSPTGISETSHPVGHRQWVPPLWWRRRGPGEIRAASRENTIRAIQLSHGVQADRFLGEMESCDVGYSEAVLSQLAEQAPALFSGTAPRPSNTSSLSFYAEHQLVELAFLRDDLVERAYVLLGSDGVHWLDGDSTPIHTVNTNESLELSDETVADYLRYFLYFLRSDGSAFILIESADEIEKVPRMTPLPRPSPATELTSRPRRPANMPACSKFGNRMNRGVGRSTRPSPTRAGSSRPRSP